MADTNPGGVNRHKAMAMGKIDGGASGVGEFPGRDGVCHVSPDVATQDELDDGDRAAGPGISGGKGRDLARQAAPDHGPQMDHFDR